MSIIWSWSSREWNRSCSPLSAARVAASQMTCSSSSSETNYGFRFEGILKIEFAMKPPSKGQKAVNSGYLSVPNHPAHSMAFELFTDDSRQVDELLMPGTASATDKAPFRFGRAAAPNAAQMPRWSRRRLRRSRGQYPGRLFRQSCNKRPRRRSGMEPSTSAIYICPHYRGIPISSFP
jgi:hypothetical protein